MASLQHILHRARRRRFVDDALTRSSFGLAAAAGAGLAVLAVDRLAGLGVPVVAFGVLLAVGALVGVVYAAVTRPQVIAVAVRLDRTLHLKDRLATAEALRTHRVGDHAFAQLVRRDAETTANSIDVKAATPIRLRRIWAGNTVLVAMLWLGIAYLPCMTWAAKRAAGPAEDNQDVVASRDEFVESINAIVEASGDNPALDERTRQDLDALDRLAAQFDATATGPELAQARDQSAARLDAMAERLSEQSQRDLTALDEVARRFRGMQPPGAGAPAPADDLTKALREGDFDEAAGRLEDIRETIDQLSETERRALADHLRQLSDHLARSAEAGNAEAIERQEPLEQALRDQGIDEQGVGEILASGPREQAAIERELRERNIDEQSARALARDLERLLEQQELDRQVEQHAETVADALEEAAEQLEQPSAPPPAPSPQPQDRTPLEPPASPEAQRPQDGHPEGQQPQPRESPSPQEADPRPQPAQRSDQPPPSPGAQEPQRRPGQPDRPPQPTDGVEQPQVERRPTDVPRDTQRPPAPGPPPRAGRPETPQDRQPGAERPSPADALRELAERRRWAEQRQQLGERAHRLARQLVSQGQRWDEPWRQEAPSDLPWSEGDDRGVRPPGLSEALPLEGVEWLDLRGDEVADQVVAEWLDEIGEQPQGKADRGTSRRIRRAREVAERAVNEAAVPARYHELIRRYFGRLGETVDRASASQAPSAKRDAEP